MGGRVPPDEDADARTDDVVGWIRSGLLRERQRFIPEEDQMDRPPLFEVLLPSGMTEFLGASENLVRGEGGRSNILYSYGPFYPGDQELRYGFLAEGQDEDGRVDVEQFLPGGALQAGAVTAPASGGGDWTR